MKALRTALITTTAALAVTAVAVAGGQRVTSPDAGATPPQPTTTQVAVCAPQGSAPKAGLVGLAQAQRAGSRRDAAPRCDGSRAQVRAKTRPRVITPATTRKRRTPGPGPARGRTA